MKYHVLAACILMIAGVAIAGCTQGTTTTPASTGTQVATETARITPQVSFSLGDHYLQDPQGYTFQTEKDVLVKEFRVDDPSWGVYFKVQPLSDDVQKCWFSIDVTDVNTQKLVIHDGYGKDQPYEREQWIAMHGDGPYKLTMTGNCAKVWVTAAKRNP
ncbi:hypothetical protein [Methanoregula formicica]|uniref:Lipoprotein n=1 Tax=Methanoregula formicica (strain DSM 22288 / NBRC 105244 / SMSP) TaxID=593750 RepID=L0HDD1_METFS|nr:hypothetical protein [Methanoregula formicica]AGB01328.1 hypothetical protein Metfor_0247 [Methanoregula formicica SMSP]